MLLPTVVGTAAGQDAKVTLHFGDPAPALVAAEWAKGQALTTLAPGIYYVVEFWATWSPPSRKSLFHLTELAKKYVGKVTCIGVDTFEHVSDPATCYPKVEKFVADLGYQMNYPVAIDDVGNTMGKAWLLASGQAFVPTVFVIDKGGKILWFGQDMANLDDVVAQVVAGTFDPKVEAQRKHTEVRDQIADQQKLQQLLQPIVDAIRVKNYREEVADIDRVSQSDPDLKPRLAFTRFQALEMYDEIAAQAFAGELADTIYSADPMKLNALARAMVQDGSPIKHLDKALAISIATRAYKGSDREPLVADTLALAYFRANRMWDAFSLEKQAIEKASLDPKVSVVTLNAMKARQKMYEKALSPAKG